MKKIDDESGIYYWKQMIGDPDKNHRSDDQNVAEEGGIIPFQENEHGFNPGLFLETYFGKLHPENKWLFGRPDRRWKSKNFQLRLNPEYWYEKNQKIGKNKIGEALPDISVLLNIPRLTNGQTRPTCVRNLKRAGAEDREIMFITGHKNPMSLKNYDPNPDFDKVLDMSMTLSNGGKSKKKKSATKVKWNDDDEEFEAIVSQTLDAAESSKPKEPPVKKPKQDENPWSDDENFDKIISQTFDKQENEIPYPRDNKPARK